jgi:hypothetical protein
MFWSNSVYLKIILNLPKKSCNIIKKYIIFEESYFLFKNYRLYATKKWAFSILSLIAGVWIGTAT